MAVRIAHTGHTHPSTPAARAACRDAMAICMTDAVDAYRDIRGVDPETALWTRLAREHQAAVIRYAELTRTPVEDVMEKVATIVDMLPERGA